MANNRPFRFGLNLVNYTSADGWRDTVRRAEEVGFSTLCFGDHHWMGLGPLASMMAAADITTRLRLASFVFGNDFRHPAILARETATIDLLSGGRVEFGIGTGWQRGDYDTRGIPFDPPGVRVSRMEEAVKVIKLFFGDEPFSFSGKYYTITDLNGLPKPVQRPRPPIMVGGGSPRTLSIAAREADIVSINFHTTSEGSLDFSTSSAADTLEKIRWVKEAAGERFDVLELNIVLLSVVVTNNRRAAAEAFTKNWHMDSSDENLNKLLDSPFFLFGTEEDMVSILRERREQYGISYFTVMGEGNIESFAPVLEQLVGD